MSIQLKYNGFIINHINYEYKNSLENQQDEYYLEFMLDNVSVAVSKEEAIITLSGHAACLNEKDNDASKYRTLNLSVNYIYNIENLNNIDDQTETQEIIKNYGVNNAIIMYQELVKQITGLDSTDSIKSYDFKFPGSLE